MTSGCEYTCISSSYFPLNDIGSYPGFSWDTVHFLLSSWYTAVLWIQHENNIVNELILWLQPSSAHLSHGLFSVPCSPSEAAQPGQLTQNGQRDIPHHRMTRSVHKLGGAACEPPISAQEEAGHQSVSGESIHAAPFVSVGSSTSLSLSLSLPLLLHSLYFNC